MKMKFLVLMIAVVSFAACEKVNNLIEVPNKMDDLNKKMDKMTTGMDTTNSNMDKMVSGMNSTVVGINDQRVFLPVKELMDEANYEKLSPIPSQLMPFGKKLAEAITVNDLAELVYLWQKEIREVNPTKQMDKEGNEIAYTDAEVTRINKIKLGRTLAIETVCGFLSDEKVNELIATHIENHSRYEETAYEILMFRTQFVRDILLKESLLSQPLSTVGKINQAVIYAQQLDFIARLPFSEKVAFKVSGFLAPYPNVIEEKLDPKMMLPLLKKIELSVKQDFKMEQQNFKVSNSSEKNAQNQQIQSDIFNKAIEQLNVGLQYWEANTPK
ncbi:MAG: hypothetical protein B7Y39_04995 [Bdellovibrio sp. 28-41-41]|nr:MAG: hypothetical protein B7Y39_04995 [Bdellovibrio sp. 28-41-41]